MSTNFRPPFRPLLKDHNYLESMKNVIQNVVNEYACLVYTETYLANTQNRESIQMKINDALFLETLLMKIRSETITYSIRKRKERFKKENSILSDLQILESISNPSDEDMQNIAHKQSELQTVRADENEGRIFRSQARWYEEGERSSS